MSHLGGEEEEGIFKKNGTFVVKIGCISQSLASKQSKKKKNPQSTWKIRSLLLKVDF